MKQIISILTIIARSTIYKIIGVLLLMAAAEGIFFRISLQNLPAYQVLPLQDFFATSRIPLVCGVAFLALCAVLCLPGFDRSGSKAIYSLARFSIGERRTALLWGCYNTFCFFLFWGTQTLLLLIFCEQYLNSVDPALVNEHTRFLAFYLNPFLHSFLPLDAFFRTLRNLALAFGLGFSCTRFSFTLRRGHWDALAVIVAAITLLFFTSGMANFSNDFIMTLFGLGAALMSVIYITKGGQNEQEINV